MRYFIDEQLEWRSAEIKHYIQEINKLTVDELINEIVKNFQDLYSSKPYSSSYAFNDEWIAEFKNILVENNTRLDLIVKAVEEKYYVLDDEEEHAWNKEVVTNFINNNPVKNRYTEEVYE